MADILRVPSIWDYISGAASQGIETYQQARERLKQEQMQQAGLYSNLFGQGLIDNTDLMPALSKVGVKAEIKPNDAQLQRQFMQSPTTNPTTGKPWTYTERKLAGLPAEGEENKASNEALTESIKTKFVKGEPLKQREAVFAGVPTDEDLTLGQLQKQNAVLAEIGPKYVDLALSKTNGRVPSNWNSVVDQAFAAYVADRKRSGLPVDPSHRAFFVSQIFERMVEQKKLDIESMNAQSNRISATRPQISAIDRQFTALNAAVETRRKALDDYMSANPIVGLKMNDPKYANDPAVTEAKRLQRMVNNAMNAQAQSASLTPQMSKLLAADANGAPVPAAQVAPKWGAREHKAAADKIINHQITLADLMPRVQSGQLTIGDYNAIQQLVASHYRKK